MAAFGGVAFTRGQLYAILKNPTYASRIVHKGKAYAGQHRAIIAEDTWQQVQDRLADHVRGYRAHRAASDALLAGKLAGPRGEPLIVAHTSKNKVRYRYYVSRDTHFDQADNGVRIPAREIESLVVQRVAELFGDPLPLAGRFALEVEPHHIRQLRQRCEELAITLKGSRRRDVAVLVQHVRVGQREVEIDIDAAAVANLLGVPLSAHAKATITLVEQVRLTRTGKVLRLVDQEGCGAVLSPPDDALIRLLGHARRWWGILAQGEVNIDTLAQQTGVMASWMTRVLRLAFLSPAVVEGLMAGKGKSGLASSALIKAGAIPFDWQEQESLYLAPRS